MPGARDLPETRWWFRSLCCPHLTLYRCKQSTSEMFWRGSSSTHTHATHSRDKFLDLSTATHTHTSIYTWTLKYAPIEQHHKYRNSLATVVGRQAGLHTHAHTNHSLASCWERLREDKRLWMGLTAVDSSGWRRVKERWEVERGRWVEKGVCVSESNRWKEVEWIRNT